MTVRDLMHWLAMMNAPTAEVQFRLGGQLETWVPTANSEISEAFDRDGVVVTIELELKD